LPAALDSAGAFPSFGFGARRQMRMYAQIFRSARKIFEKSKPTSLLLVAGERLEEGSLCGVID